MVEAYKGLKVVEADFRSLKAIDLDLRPVHHYLEDQVRAHVFICMLAAYVVWHLRKAWAPIGFTDEDPPARTDPVAPAEPSPAAKTKAARKTSTDGAHRAHSLVTLLDHLGTLTRNTIVFAGGLRVDKLAVPTPLQRRAFELIGAPIPHGPQHHVDRTTTAPNKEPPAQQRGSLAGLVGLGLGHRGPRR